MAQSSNFFFFIIIWLTMSNLKIRAEETTRFCGQCVSGNFVSHRLLNINDENFHMDRQPMFNNRQAVMSYHPHWLHTNCLDGTMHIVPCERACVAIILFNTKTGQFDSMMNDCTDDLMIVQPDIPSTFNLVNVITDAEFHSVRGRFNVDYYFTLNNETVASVLQKIKSKLPVKPPTFSTFTIQLIYTFVLTLMFATGLTCYHYVIFKTKLSMQNEIIVKFYKDRELKQTDPDVENITEEAQPSDYYQIEGPETTPAGY